MLTVKFRLVAMVKSFIMFAGKLLLSSPRTLRTLEKKIILYLSASKYFLWQWLQHLKECEELILQFSITMSSVYFITICPQYLLYDGRSNMNDSTGVVRVEGNPITFQGATGHVLYSICCLVS